MPKLSIIVPVYETGKYIDKCIQSILNQTFTDFELILIEDGSTDKSSEICDDFCLKDTRIKTIHKVNAGVSSARNTGFELAVGEYVGFIDSDDWVEPQMYEKMMANAIEYDCDVVMCDCVKDYSNHSKSYTHAIRPGFYNYEQLQREYYPHLLMMENVEYPPTISNCLCLFRQSRRQPEMQIGMEVTTTDQQHHSMACLRYVDGVRFSEDLLFGAQMMYQAKSFYYMKDEKYYHYCMNPASATHTLQKDKWKDYLKLHEEAEKYFMGRSYNFRQQLDYLLLFFVYNALADIKKAELTIDDQKVEYLNILQNAKVKDMFSRISIINLRINWKLKLLTFAYKYHVGLKMILKYV